MSVLISISCVILPVITLRCMNLVVSLKQNKYAHCFFRQNNGKQLDSRYNTTWGIAQSATEGPTTLLKRRWSVLLIEDMGKWRMIRWDDLHSLKMTSHSLISEGIVPRFNTLNRLKRRRPGLTSANSAGHAETSATIVHTTNDTFNCSGCIACERKQFCQHSTYTPLTDSNPAPIFKTVILANLSRSK